MGTLMVLTVFLDNMASPCCFYCAQLMLRKTSSAAAEPPASRRVAPAPPTAAPTLPAVASERSIPATALSLPTRTSGTSAPALSVEHLKAGGLRALLAHRAYVAFFGL